MKAEQVYDEIKLLKDRGTLPKLISAGLISPKASTYLDITERVEYKAQRSKRVLNKIIIMQVATEFRCSETTVYRALSTMRRPLHTRGNNVL